MNVLPESYIPSLEKFIIRVVSAMSPNVQPGIVEEVDTATLTASITTLDGAGGRIDGIPYYGSTPAVRDRVYYINLGASVAIITGGRGSVASTRATAGASFRPMYVGRGTTPPTTATGYQVTDRWLNSEPQPGTPAEWVLCTDRVWRATSAISS